MAQQNPWGRQGAEWRDLAWAVGGAAAIAFFLAIAVALVWSIGRAPSPAPAASVSHSTTPTPRALVFARTTPTHTAPAKNASSAERTPPAAVSATGTPQLLAMNAGDLSRAAGQGPIFKASSGAEFSPLAARSWKVNDETLVNDGSNPVAEPWLRLAGVPTSSFAVEAEVRVTKLLSTVCDQSFGLAAGDPGANAVYGAGVLFPCDNKGPVARLTDVTVWEDGYNADPVFAEKPFDPGQGWHTYRFEVHGQHIRLLVDGVEVVSGDASAALDPASSGEEAGIWTQGAAVEVRRVTIVPLPAG